ncbi:MAG: helix-turn-helix transcriptional regulator, partial [Selenomonadaceae bacterium]|nr:helix-turn-helix transcriptional regulator [Selenomonadaceae bacterium]
GRTWKQARQELFSPEEIAASNARVEIMIALSKARKEKGLTQKELSEIAGVRQSAISRLENGNTPNQIDTLIRLFAAMNMKMQVVPMNN